MKGVGHVDDVRAMDELGEFGRTDAVSILFRAHHRRLVGLAALLVDDRATAEDVVQDAFAGLCRRWRQLRDPNAAVAYLNRAVVNGGRDRLRRGRRATAGRLRMVPSLRGARLGRARRPRARRGRPPLGCAHRPAAPPTPGRWSCATTSTRARPRSPRRSRCPAGSVKRHASRGLESLAHATWRPRHEYVGTGASAGGPAPSAGGGRNEQHEHGRGARQAAGGHRAERAPPPPYLGGRRAGRGRRRGSAGRVAPGPRRRTRPTPTPRPRSSGPSRPRRRSSRRTAPSTRTGPRRTWPTTPP